MSSVNRKMITAVLAVRMGKLTPETAAKLVRSGDIEAANRDLEAALKSGDVSIEDVEKIRLAVANDGDLAGLGLDETTIKALSDIKKLEPRDARVKDTLLSISPTRMVADLQDDELEVIDAGATSETSNPTNVIKDSPGVRKSSSQIMRAAKRDERYSIKREHARGGMGRILIARDNVVGRDVALKELLTKPTTGSVSPNTEISHGLTERFLREAKVTGQLEHPNIVSVYEIGKDDDDSLYYTMKFVRGQTLAERLQEIEKDETLNKKEKLAARLKLLDNFADVCNAIAYAHSKGVIHRDLKPENIMIGEYGETVVLDWGLARVHGQEDTVAAKLMDSTRYMSQIVTQDGDTDQLTLDGSIVGTPAYMSPEQARGDLEDIDEQSDVYSLGAVLYQLLAGRPPFDGPLPGVIIQQVLHGQPMKLSEAAPETAPELEALVENAMAKEKPDRLANARELASEIKAFRDGRTLTSYSYSPRELFARWMGRHKKAVIAGTIFFYVLVAGAAFHYVQLRNEKDAVEAQKLEAQEAEQQAKQNFEAARAAEAEAKTERDRAEIARAEAVEAKRLAEEETTEKERALLGWDETLADAYAMRVRLAVENRNFNSALAFAGKALESAEQADARGALLSLPEIYPLLWHLSPAKPSKQEIYDFYDVSFSPDGTLIATGHSDGRVLLWSAEDGTLIQELRSATGVILDVAFSPSGNRLVGSGRSGGIHVWKFNATTDRYVDSDLVLDAPPRPQERVHSVAFSPDGRYLAAALKKVYLWDTHTGALLGSFEGGGNHQPMIVSFSPDGATVLSSTALFTDPFVRVWDVKTLKLKRALFDTTGVNEVYTAWSPDGKLLASGSLQGQIRIRDAKTFRILTTLTSHTSTVLDLEFSNDSRTLISCSVDGTVRLWDMKSYRNRAVLRGMGGIIQSVAFAPDGKSFCARDVSGDVRVWSTSERDKRALVAHTSDVMDVSYSPDGKHFASAGWDGAVVVWDGTSGQPIQRFERPLDQFFAVDFLDDGKKVIAGGGGGIFVWEVETGELIARLISDEVVTDLQVAADGKTFIAAHYREATRFDVETMTELGKFGRHSQLCMTTRQSADGSRVVTGSYDGLVLMWHGLNDERPKVVQRRQGSVFSVDITPDARFVAAGGEDSVVRVYNSDDQKTVHELSGHVGMIFCVRFSRDGKRLFSGSQDGTIRVWNLEDGTALAVLYGHKETVSRLALSPDGTTLLSGSQDDLVRSWNLDSLSWNREDFVALALALTGLEVGRQEFAARAAANWPDSVIDHPALRRERRTRREEIREYASEFEMRFESYRFVDRDVAGQGMMRHYLARRRLDSIGRPRGKAVGEIKYAAWWADQHPELAELLGSRAPQITSVNADGQAERLGLEVGDYLWEVGGERVRDRDGLKARLGELADQTEFRLVIRRYVLDDNNQPVAKRDADGDYFLNEDGETYFEFETFTVTAKPGALGVRIGDGGVPPRSYR